MNPVFDIDRRDDGESLELFAEELAPQRQAWSDCASTVYTFSSEGSSIGTLSSAGSISSTGGSG